MRVVRNGVLFAAALLVACSAPFAVELTSGGNELITDFSYTDTDNVGKTTDLSLAYGWLLTSNHEVGPKIAYSKFDGDGTATSVDVDGGELGGFYNYNFANNSKTMVPFVGGSLFKVIGDADEFFGFGAEVTGGLRVMPSNTASINIRAFYEQNYGKSGVEDANSSGIAAGLSIFW